MPIAGLGLHFLVALFFAIHAARTGQQMYWLFVLFSFPLLGSIVYFFAIYMPGSSLQWHGRKALSAAGKVLDPQRELREARHAFDLTPTAQHQMRLAAALLDAGEPRESAALYEACLKGPFASDLEIRLGAAQALVACDRPADALEHLAFVRRSDPHYKAEAVGIATARALGGAGRTVDAVQAFESTVERFGSFAAKAQYVLWAVSAGQVARARQLYAEIEQTRMHWPRHAQQLNRAMLNQLRSSMSTLVDA
ncbi:tetratricopeptide repeat protein [soil metagenome]